MTIRIPGCLGPIAIAMSTMVSAQSAPAGPAAGGLFGSTDRRSGPAGESLQVTVSLAGAFDADRSHLLASPTRRSAAAGQYSNLDTSVTFTRRRPHLGVAAGALGSMRRYG